MIEIAAKVDLKDLAEQLSSEANEVALLKFVKDLDAAVADWRFTEKLAAHFNRLMKDK